MTNVLVTISLYSTPDLGVTAFVYPTFHMCEHMVLWDMVELVCVLQDGARVTLGGYDDRGRGLPKWEVYVTPELRAQTTQLVRMAQRAAADAYDARVSA